MGFSYSHSCPLPSSGTFKKTKGNRVMMCITVRNAYLDSTDTCHTCATKEDPDSHHFIKAENWRRCKRAHTLHVKVYNSQTRRAITSRSARFPHPPFFWDIALWIRPAYEDHSTDRASDSLLTASRPATPTPVSIPGSVEQALKFSSTLVSVSATVSERFSNGP